MEIFRKGDKMFSIVPKSVIDSLPIKLEEPEIKIDKTPTIEMIKRKRGRPPKAIVQPSIVHGSDRSTVDGQWVRKDESDVGDGVKVKAECEPEIQGCDAENVVIIKNEPVDDNYNDAIKNDLRFNNNTNDRSTLNIKEEPLDIYHENFSDDLNDSETKEVYVEKLNYNIMKKEVLEENEFDRQMKENFIKCESAIKDDDEENHSESEPIEKRHKCPKCLKSYKNKGHLNRHVYYECAMRDKSAKSRYKCSDCHMHFKTKYTMERHFGSKHLKDGERSSCDACCKTFRDEKALKKHLRRFLCNGAPTNTFICKNCNKEYRHATSVWRHRKYECEQMPRFGCAHCDYKTLQKGNIVKHFRRKHDNEGDREKYNCPKCKRTYKNEYTLSRHLNVECGKEPAFSCAHCKFKTKRKYSLDMHIRHRHNLKRSALK